MDRAVPTNEILQKRIIQTNKKIHAQAKKAVSKQIDNAQPISLNYPIIKKKKEKLVEGKLALFNCVIMFRTVY